MVNHLKIEVSPNPEFDDCPDHQARIIVDGQDWLGTETIGLDPPDLDEQLSQKDQMIVGRCPCGVMGCGDLVVEVQRTDKTIRWSDSDGIEAVFDTQQFDAEVDRFRKDHSWETLERRVEREVGPIFKGIVIDKEYRFSWVSARSEPCKIHVCFQGHRKPILLDFDWDGETVSDVLQRAQRFLIEDVLPRA
jgi:hypothetical protein